MQTDTAGTYTLLNASPSKAIDYLVAIAGWPTLYSVSSTGYTLATTTAGSDALGQFTGVQNIVSDITGAGAAMKGRPEDGALTIASLKVTLLDRRDPANSGKRAGSDLHSRGAYIFGNQSGFTTTLNGDLTASATTVVLTDGTNFAASSVIYIGQEAILLGTKSTNTYTGCTRAYRLTNATPHLSAVKVYGFMPNLYRRPVFVFKGYQSQSSTAGWLRCFGGIITGEQKDSEKFTITAAANTWETYAAGTKKIVTQRILSSGEITSNNHGVLIGSHYTGDFTNVQVIVSATGSSAATGLGDGHYLMKVEDAWYGITGISSGFLDVGPVITVDVVKSLGGTPIHDHLGSTGAGQNTTPVVFGWSNVDFSVSPPTGDEPIKLILKFLLSVKGDGANHATYDVFKAGIGLGIPAAMVDVTSFTNLMAANDYDSNQRVFFAFTEPVGAKDFIEAELCKPFGYSLITGNDGKIRLIRHQSPQHLYIANSCNGLNFTYTAGGNVNAVQTTLRSGSGANIGNTTPATPGNVYTGAEMATEVAWALNAASAGGFGCSYSTTTNKFTITNAAAFTLVSGPDNAWTMLGFTTFNVSNTTQTSDVVVCVATASTTAGKINDTLTESDVVEIVALDSRDTQIASVNFWANYDFINDKYRTQLPYLDAEAVNLGDELGAREYQIKSKGLLRLNGVIRDIGSPWVGHVKSNGCRGTRVTPDSSWGFDGGGSWAEEYAYSLLHRYKQPPIVLKAKLTWKHNLLEVGDNVKLTYSLNSVFADPERGTETLAGRNFEVAAITCNFMTGTVDTILVGHRWQGF